MNAPGPVRYVFNQDSIRFANQFADGSIDLLAFDPPYFGIVDEGWDNQWKSVDDFVWWFVQFVRAWRPKLAPHGSVVFFGGLGKHGERPFYRVQLALEEPAARMNLTYRNTITWKKRKAYGKSHDYLFTREEIVWYSASPERTNVRFNIPLTNELRGYAGWNPKYPAKSPFKRVSNVWVDIPELMKTERTAQKPVPLMDRIINTHSNPGDLVVDPFSGWGTTGVSAVELGRRFQGCEGIPIDAEKANQRVTSAAGRPPRVIGLQPGEPPIPGIHTGATDYGDEL